MKRFSTVILACIYVNFCLAQTSSVKEYLGVAGPLVFAGNSYSLSWSSHPSGNYYKQEYLLKGDTADKFKAMILLDVITASPAVKDIVAAKIAELKQMKLTNPLIQYEMFNNSATGEYMLDFLVSANAPGGNEPVIVERNVYRYKSFTDKKGKKGILLFGVSTRGYGKEIDKFLTALKINKKELVTQVSQYKIPGIQL